MDDDEAVRDLPHIPIAHFVYIVDIAEEGNNALKMYKDADYRHYRCDDVIMDLTIPQGMGGNETIAKTLEFDPVPELSCPAGTQPILLWHISGSTDSGGS
jgi:DNA-binding response OmpR family regulator